MVLKTKALLSLVIAVVITAFVQPSFAKTDVLFEGYSKILSGGVHIGYIVNRYEFDSKKKQFISTSFLKTNEFGGNLTESIKAYSTDTLKPVSYQYTTLVGKETKIIDAKFDKNKLNATVKTGARVDRISKDLPEGAFLSTMLAYTMLRSPQGFKTDTKYEFKAIAEEDAAVYDGIAFVKEPETYNGLKAFRVINEFKKVKFVSSVSEKGEVFATKSPAQSIATELVAQPSQATANFAVPSSTLKALFGDIPSGQKNELAEKTKAGVVIPPAATKQEGVPAGDIQLKNQPAAQPEKAKDGK